MTYGTYILFGVLTYIGAAFVWFTVPETKRLSLEEMVCCFAFILHRQDCHSHFDAQDLIFGSEGTAQADTERMEEINHEIGLHNLLHLGRVDGEVADVIEKEHAV